MQLPDEQTWLLLQLLHTPPFLPQADEEVPLTQVPFWQQPLGQVAGPHDGGDTHCWLVHVCGLVQLAHCAPPVPHADDEVPATQVPPWQQPLAQVDGPHDGGETHCWLVHDWPPAHALQTAPPVPHAEVVVPG